MVFDDIIKHIILYSVFFIGIKIYREQSKKAKDVGRWAKENQNRRSKRAPGFYHPDPRTSEYLCM